MAVRKSRKRSGFVIYSDSALARVAGVKRGRERGNLSARERVGSADSSGCLLCTVSIFNNLKRGLVLFINR